MSVAVRDAYAGNAVPHVLFTPRIDTSNINQERYIVTSDGQRFLVIEQPEASPGFEYTILLDWRHAAEPR